MWEPSDRLGQRTRARIGERPSASKILPSEKPVSQPCKIPNISNPKIPSELLILNRFGIGYPYIKAAWNLSLKYGIEAREVLFRAGVISEKIWADAQFLLKEERRKSVQKHQMQRHLVDQAVNNLHRNLPHYSAHRTFTAFQLAMLSMCLSCAFAILYIDARGFILAVLVLLSSFYTAVILTRTMLVAWYDYRVRGNQNYLPVIDSALPEYSILVPLYKEANQIEELCLHLCRLNWPREKLDIKLICERDDLETIAAIHDAKLPEFFKLVIVPHAEPRTKPKALNYALPMCSGKYVVIYDAEDRPAPNQLREAYARFSVNDGTLACLQAPLIISNDRQNWITSMFFVEYITLFKGVLPVLARWQVPIPLGGTSNHFDKEILMQIGGWDPYNVTEDADLGIRLFREGYRSSTISLPTYEEAPPYLIPWIKQRTRWMKGWMQTILVHNRNPLHLMSDLGGRNTLVFHLLLTSIVISALIHPFFIVGTIAELFSLLPQSDLNSWFIALGIFNLVAGYSTYGMLAWMVLKTNRCGHFGPFLLFLPLYWLLISFAAWRAVLHLIVKPHRWEKTPHGLAKHENSP